MKKKIKYLIFIFFALFIVILGSKTVMAEPNTSNTLPIPKINFSVDKANTPKEYVDNIKILVLMTVLALLPSIVIMTTSFIRIIVVLSLFKNAIGAQQSIPREVLIGLALFLTFFIMAPTYNKINDEAIKPYLDNKLTNEQAWSKGTEPLREFMLKQTKVKDLKLFLEIGNLEDKVKVKVDDKGKEISDSGGKVYDYSDVPTYAIIPAFIISELKIAFEIGFLLFIPFLIIDIVTGSILMSMGMFMVPPVMISLPFKLLLFVMVDGWHLLVRALILSFR
ncbi:flagellar type III secretion system pore protein FliP [Hathewaya histolytica]|uniref:Flagellar biosynthetic protein FliP n=1 Tax=Hathewaya histolytica TaxID=1498 RepID=A0A4U9RA46_HATHI|nr:flagellar type III secretion system pore protein FliP [Hathewaya histolytica]VTQ87758.1 flagellar biosynthetic protein FliP [Hathewaya histolytica]